jgi:hypothetical protein
MDVAFLRDGSMLVSDDYAGAIWRISYEGDDGGASTQQGTGAAPASGDSAGGSQAADPSAGSEPASPSATAPETEGSPVQEGQN